MDYEEKTINGVTRIAYNGCWYLLPPEYPEEPPYDEDMAQFPFYDLTNYDLQDLIDDECWEWPCKMPARRPDWLAEDWLRFNP